MRARNRDGFDAELGSAARSLVSEPLPGAILEIPLGSGIDRPLTRTGFGGWGPLAVALASALLLIGVAVATGTLRLAPAPPPVLHSTATLAGMLRGAGLTCNDPGAVVGASRGSEPVPAPALTCRSSPTIHPVVAGVVIDEVAAGAPSGVTIEADVLGAASSSDRTRRSDLLYFLVGMPFKDPEDAAAARAWIRKAGRLEPGVERTTTITGQPVRYARMIDGAERVLIGDVAPSP